MYLRAASADLHTYVVCREYEHMCSGCYNHMQRYTHVQWLVQPHAALHTCAVAGTTTYMQRYTHTYASRMHLLYVQYLGGRSWFDKVHVHFCNVGAHCEHPLNCCVDGTQELMTNLQTVDHTSQDNSHTLHHEQDESRCSQT